MLSSERKQHLFCPTSAHFGILDFVAESRSSVSRPLSTNAQARKRRAAVQRLLPAAVLAVGLIGTPMLLVSSGGLGRLEELQKERSTVELEISRLGKRIEHLRARTQAIRTSPDAVERAARDELGLVRRTEVVYQFDKPQR